MFADRTKDDNYVFPIWAEILGILVLLSCIIWIPLVSFSLTSVLRKDLYFQVALIMFIKAAFKHGLANNAREVRRKLFEPTPLWGPSRTASKTVKDAWETSKRQKFALKQRLTLQFRRTTTPATLALVPQAMCTMTPSSRRLKLMRRIGFECFYAWNPLYITTIPKQTRVFLTSFFANKPDFSAIICHSVQGTVVRIALTVVLQRGLRTCAVLYTWNHTMLIVTLLEALHIIVLSSNAHLVCEHFACLLCLV